MRPEGNKRKTVEEEEESMLRKTLKYLKTLERGEAKKEYDETQEVVELAEVEVHEEDVECRTEGETQFEDGKRRPGSGAGPTRSGGGDALHGQDAGS